MNNTKKKKSWIILSVTVLLVALISVIAYRRRETLEISYTEVPAGRGDVEVTILATGTVQPENRVEIKPPVPGRVEQVLAKEGQHAKKGQVLAWMSSTERAALLDAARAQGPEEVKKWEENYKPTPILAPIDGTIILRNVESGQTFTSTDSVFVMSDRLTVKAQVDETDIAEIKSGQHARLVLDAYPNNVISASVDKIAFDATTVNNVTTYIVDVLPQDTPDFMRSGMTANVTFFVTSRENVLFVPNNALHVRDNTYTVLVKGAGEAKPVEKTIQVGITDGKRTEVMGGLSGGETLLVAGIQAKGGANRPSNPLSPFGGRRKVGGH